MAKCAVGVSFDEDCGPSRHHKEKQASQMLTVNECKRDISGHLKMFKLKQDISSEGDLICYRAGEYT